MLSAGYTGISTTLTDVTPAALDLPATGGERGVLPAADRVPVADAAAGLPAAQHRLRLLPGLDRGRGLGACPRRALPAEPGAGGPRREPDRRDHRQPERQNRRGGAGNGRLRRRGSGSRAASATSSPTRSATDFHEPDEARFQARMDGGRCAGPVLHEFRGRGKDIKFAGHGSSPAVGSDTMTIQTPPV